MYHTQTHRHRHRHTDTDTETHTDTHTHTHAQGKTLKQGTVEKGRVTGKKDLRFQLAALGLSLNLIKLAIERASAVSLNLKLSPIRASVTTTLNP